jgi:hypothetical protein
MQHSSVEGAKRSLESLGSDATGVGHSERKSCGAGACGALGSAPPAPAAAQEDADAPSRKVIRTNRLRMPADLFERDAVSFKRARVEAGGTIRADGHNLDLYGLELIPRNRICAPEGAPRWGLAGRTIHKLQLHRRRGRAESRVLGRRHRRDAVAP